MFFLSFPFLCPGKESSYLKQSHIRQETTTVIFTLETAMSILEKHTASFLIYFEKYFSELAYKVVWDFFWSWSNRICSAIRAVSSGHGSLKSFSLLQSSVESWADHSLDSASKPCAQSRVLYRTRTPPVSMQGFWLPAESSSKKPAEDSVVLSACRWKWLTKPLLKFSAGQVVFSQCKSPPPPLLLSQESFPTPMPFCLPHCQIMTAGKKKHTSSRLLLHIAQWRRAAMWTTLHDFAPHIHRNPYTG